MTFPVWLAPMLAGMGQFAGGISGLFGGSGNQGFDAHDAYKMRVRQAMYMPTYIRQGMERAGYHPLTAMGMNPAQGPQSSAFAGKNVGRAMANMGQGLSRAISGQSELQKAQAGYYRALEGKIKNEQQETDNISESITEDSGLYQTPIKSTQSGKGWETGQQGSNKVTFNPEGFLIIAPTQGLEDFVSEDMLSKIRFHAPTIIRGAKAGYYAVAPYTENARKFRKELRKYLNALEKSHPPPRGMYYTWSIEYGTPRRIPISKYKKQQLFDRPTKRLGIYDRYIKSTHY